jgi:hypothetical protein
MSDELTGLTKRVNDERVREEMRATSALMYSSL